MEEQSTNSTVLPSPKPQDYYVTRSKKVVDFMIGFFISIIIFIVGGIIIGAIGTLAQSLIVIVTLIVLFIMLYIAAIIYFFKKRRRFIAIGILMATLIPYLLFGACWLILGSMS